MASLTLALDTSTSATVVAATGDGVSKSLCEPAPAGQRPAHTERLLAMAEQALADLSAEWVDVQRIVVGTGPGTFTGIRVALATARSLVISLDAELFAVPSHCSFASSSETRLVVQDARRGELFLSVLQPNSAPLEVIPKAVPISAFPAFLEALETRPESAFGDRALSLVEELGAAGIAVSADPMQHQVDGLGLIKAAEKLRPIDATEAKALYVRDADAIPTARR